jgi:DNA-binding LacI/PurR family transcriptional regulator
LKRKPKVTLHEVAEAAGVSIATVSKTLNNLHVSSTSRKKVLEAASRLDYVANHTARVLRGGVSMTIGLIFSELSTTRGVNLLDAMSAALDAAGYSLICATARADADVYEVLMSRFLERRIDGLFCVTPPPCLPSVSRYEAAGIPIVALTERSAAVAAHPLVRPSIAVAARAAMRDIVAFGHRHILSIDDGSRNLSLATLDGRWLKQVSIEQVRLGEIGDLSELVRTLHRRKNRPTLISAFQPQAEGLLAVCNAMGMRVGRDLSIIALTQASDEDRPGRLGLSSVTLRPELLAAEAAAHMLALLQGTGSKQDRRVELGCWNPRSSLGPA